jgi:hypothetical protein
MHNHTSNIGLVQLLGLRLGRGGWLLWCRMLTSDSARIYSLRFSFIIVSDKKFVLPQVKSSGPRMEEYYAVVRMDMPD